jgi:hypothetical protein
VVSIGARKPLPEDAFAPYVLVRELGARPLPAFLVRQAAPSGAKPHLFVAERFIGAALEPDGKDSGFLRDARRIATITSPNLPRVREVVVHDEDVLAFTEFVDGEKLSTLWRPDALPLEIALRALVDVLSGATALHNLRDARQQPLKVAHGELSPATIALGLDGVARVLHGVARRAPQVVPDPSSLRTMAPEVLAGEPYDLRADVFSVGVLLWEALSGRPLFTGTDATALLEHMRRGDVPRASVPTSAPWAKDLVEVAARALKIAPEERWATATAMAGELRRAAGLKLAAVSTTAAFAKSAIAERAKTRRAELETRAASIRPPLPVLSNAVVIEPVAVSEGDSPAVEGSPRTPVAGPAASVAAPVAPPPRPPSSVVSPPRVASPPAVSRPAVSPPASTVPSLAEPTAAAPSSEDVLVAPGIHAPVTEVIELGSEALLPDSVPPPPPPSGEGPSLDPFKVAPLPAEGEPVAPSVAPAVTNAASAPPAGAPEPIVVEPFPLVPLAPAPLESPAPLAPAPAPAAPVAAPIEPVIVDAPHQVRTPAPVIDFAAPAAAAGHDVDALLAYPLRAPQLTSPSMMRQSEQARAAARRKWLVLGSVGALGGAILALAAARWVARDRDARHATLSRPAAAHTATTPPSIPPVPSQPGVPAAVPISTPAVAAPSLASPPSIAAAGPPARATPAAHPKPPAPPRPNSAAAPRPRKPKPAFDPNTL